MVCCVSVLPNFDRYAKYNLLQLAERHRPQGDSDEPAAKRQRLDDDADDSGGDGEQPAAQDSPAGSDDGAGSPDAAQA